MNEPRMRLRFSVRDLLVVMIVLCVTSAVAAPFILRAREEARKSECAARIRQWGLACLNYESARRHFPLAGDYLDGLVVQGTNDPGQLSGSTATGGYSWQVQVLPYLVDATLAAKIEKGTGQFAREPFAAAHVTGGPANAQFLWELDEPILHCPARGIATRATGAHSAVRYRNVAPVLTNYLAMVGTHYDPKAEPPLVQNGILVGSDAIPGRSIKGIPIGLVTDGSSNTVLVCESREATYASWYDGSTAWTLGVPDASVPETNATSGYLHGGEVGLNYGPDGEHPERKFFTAGGPFYGLGRSWGPSSVHPGGAVVILWADGHAQTLNSKYVDSATWMAIITRGNNESSGCGCGL